MSGDIIELLIYHQPGVKPSLTLHPFGVLGYVAGHSLTMWWLVSCAAASPSSAAGLWTQISPLGDRSAEQQLNNPAIGYSVPRGLVVVGIPQHINEQ